MSECGGMESQLEGEPDKAEYPIYKVITDRKHGVLQECAHTVCINTLLYITYEDTVHDGHDVLHVQEILFIYLQ